MLGAISLARRRASQSDTMESEMPIPGLLVFTLKNVHLARFTTIFFQIYFIFFCLYLKAVGWCCLQMSRFDVILWCVLIGQWRSGCFAIVATLAGQFNLHLQHHDVHPNIHDTTIWPLVLTRYWLRENLIQHIRIKSWPHNLRTVFISLRDTWTLAGTHTRLIISTIGEGPSRVREIESRSCSW